MYSPNVDDVRCSLRKEGRRQTSGGGETADWNVQDNKLCVLVKIFLWCLVQRASFAMTQHSGNAVGTVSTAGATVSTAGVYSLALKTSGTWEGC